MKIIEKVSDKAIELGERNIVFFSLLTYPFYVLVVIFLTILVFTVGIAAAIESVYKKRTKYLKADIKSIWSSYKEVYTHPHSPLKVLTRHRYIAWQSRAMLASLTQ